MLKGYVDGSNLHQKDGLVVSVAGCVATTDLWGKWQEKWDDLLAVVGLDRWHHSEFMAHIYTKAGRTYNWPEAEWLMARRILSDAFEAGRPFSFGATISQSDYGAVRTRYDFLPEDPYYFCLIDAYGGLFKGIPNIPKTKV